MVPRIRPGQFQERPSSTEIVEILRVAAGCVKVYIARVQNANECESPGAVYLCNKLRRPQPIRMRATLMTRRR